MELQYHGIDNFLTVSKNDIAVLLNFGISQSSNKHCYTHMPARTHTHACTHSRKHARAHTHTFFAVREEMFFCRKL